MPVDSPKYIEIGVCGLSCRLCPSFNSQSDSRCSGCKSPERMRVGCSFITCAVKKKGLDFCWECNENKACKKWKSHRDASKVHDSFKCYQTLEADIALILSSNVEEFNKQQRDRETILKTMLAEFNDGRSKSYYCIASTVLPINELHKAMKLAKEQTKDVTLKEKAAVLHSILNKIAEENHYLLKLRK